MDSQDTQISLRVRDLSGDWRARAAAPTAALGQDTPAANLSSHREGPYSESEDIPDDQNCATWWFNLPPNCTYTMLFASLRNIGAVSDAVISPRAENSSVTTAQVVFFDRASVDRLLGWTSRLQHEPIRIGGRQPHIRISYNKVAAHSNAVPPTWGYLGRGSRVLDVIGDRRIVTERRLKDLLADPQNNFICNLEQVHTFSWTGPLSCVEFRFASYAGQALRARTFFEDQKSREDLPTAERALWETVVCFFAPDPCDHID
ncbi:hypothetical protein NUW58_g5015 [Xylaria curta]|uniref:Uncharacterized protein n=1 Tax=Xylaria curta TaxID=42375 RepID=A0ACC1P5C4_9PEZI|nr:hypothetical protein NUW58_g5015 [Xylaria curta]